MRISSNPFLSETNSSVVKRQSGVLAWEEASVFHDEGGSNEIAEDAGIGTRWLRLGAVIILVLIASRLVYLQIWSHASFSELAAGNRTRTRIILAPRGKILDRYQTVLADNKPGFSLAVTPADLPSAQKEQIISAASLLFRVSVEEINEALAKPGRSLDSRIIKTNLTAEEALTVATKVDEFPGFALQTVPIRNYHNSEAFSHVLGYVGSINEEELKQLPIDRYHASDVIGKLGLEKTYEQYVHGLDGQEQIEVNATGKAVRVLGQLAPEAGATAVLNLDNDLQKLLYEAFNQKGKQVRGAAIALDPRNGEVLALVSSPGFNNNLFAKGITGAEYKQLLDDQQLPLFNRATAGTYPPGSTVKPMVSLAGLEEKLITENTIITDNGLLVIPNQYDPSRSYNFYGWKRSGLGPMTVTSAIAQSSDIYFYTLAGGHPSSPVKPLGIERLAEYYRKFNLGKPTGIDVPGEKSGVVADPAWKAEYFKGDAILSKWHLGNTYHVGIGQGDMLVTPLQVAHWTATIAQNGTGYVPRLLKEVVDGSGKIIFKTEPKIIIPPFASPENWKIIQKGMRETITAGSGKKLDDLPITSAGKTGTSQFDGADLSKTHAWFTAYAPFENPEIVITVLVEAGGEGNEVAVPIAKQALAWWAKERYTQK